jgi:signal transduction histidine kinase
MRLRAEMLDNAELQGKLQADLDAMQALVREGIAYARSAHGEAEAPARVDLDALLDSLVCDWRDAGHELTLTGKVGRPVMTRPQALRRIVTNLVDNALKFATAVEIAVEAGTGGNLVVVVRDRGPGIPPAELDAELQPFYRLEASRNRTTGGTGLGLAIASELATALGGTLTLANRTGGGLEARLDLPVQAAREDFRQAAPSWANSQRLRGSPPP